MANDFMIYSLNFDVLFHTNQKRNEIKKIGK